MRNLIIVLAMCLALAVPSISEAKIVKRGNQWVQVDSTKTKKNKPADKQVGVYTDKNGKKYPVYQGPKGGYYYIKDGKKRYLPKK